MRVIFFTIGVIGLGLSGWLFITTMAGREDFWTGCLASGAGGVASAGILTAVIQRYNGHWPFVIGSSLLVFAFAGLGSEIDDYLTNRSSDRAIGVLLITLFSVCGVLLLISGHKLHRCLAECDALRDRWNNAAASNAEPNPPPPGGPAASVDTSNAPGGPPSVI